MTARALRDVDDLMQFISRQPWGRPSERLADIYRGFDEICRSPELHRPEVYRRSAGLELRRHHVAQFTIIYAYIPPSEERPRGIVSIRAVRHSRVKNVFSGVREPPPEPYVERRV